MKKILKKNIFSKPQHPYTNILISSQAKKKSTFTYQNDSILKTNQLKVWYPIKKGFLKRTVDYVKAVDSINFKLRIKQTLGIVGESGSGKTSLVLAMLKLISSKWRNYFQTTECK